MRDQKGFLSIEFDHLDRRPVFGERVRANGRLFVLALLVFLLNQALEYSLLRSAEADYRVLCGWDCGWYAGVAERGYDLQPHAHPRGDAANWAFFPAFPLTAAAVAAIADISTPMALVVTAKIFFLLAIFAFVKFAQVWAPAVPSWLAAAVVGLHPYALYGNVGYTESMFLLFSCLGLYALGRQQFVAAGAGGAVLSAVRPVGVFIVIPLLIAGLRRFPEAHPQERLRILLGAMLVPLGLSLFMIHLHRVTGDALAFSHVQIAWDRVPGNPLGHLLAGLRGVEPLPRLWAFMSLVALLMVAALFFRRQYELASFSLIATLVPLSTGLLAMPRYLWWQAPLLLLMAQWLSLRLISWPTRPHIEVKVWMIALPLSVWGCITMVQAWINGEWFVV